MIFFIVMFSSAPFFFNVWFMVSAPDHSYHNLPVEVKNCNEMSTYAPDTICANFCKLVALVEDFIIKHNSFSVI